QEIDPLGDTLPPRYAIESDDEDEYNPISSTRESGSSVDLNIRFAGNIKQGSPSFIVSGNTGREWARGAKLGEQRGAIYVNEIQIGLLFEPSWVGAVVLVSEATAKLPLWAMNRYAEAVINHLQPSSVVLLDSYAVHAYISSEPVIPHDAPVRYLADEYASIPPSSDIKIQLFAPPNLVQYTSAAFMAELSLRSIRSPHPTSTILILLPSPHIDPSAPASLITTQMIPLSNNIWSAQMMQPVQHLMCTFIGENVDCSWENHDSKTNHKIQSAKRFGDVGEGSMYI
ncbi:hypothetical protein BJ138DRAFT_1017328, partial [Hygrophoropsis aurantiaca]